MNRLDHFLALSSALLRTRDQARIAELSAAGAMILLPRLSMACVIWRDADGSATVSSPYATLFEMPGAHIEAVAYLDPVTPLPADRTEQLIAALRAQWRACMFDPQPAPQSWTVDEPDVQAPFAAAFPGYTPTRHLYMCPVTTSDARYGALLVGADSDSVFDADTTHMIIALAEQSALAFENAILYEQTRAGASEAEALNTIARAIGASLNIAELFNTVVYHTHPLIEFSSANLALINEDSETFDIVQHWAENEREPETNATGIVLAGTPIGQAVFTRDLTIVHTADNPETLAYIPGTQADPLTADRILMIVPLISKRRVLGAFALGSRNPDAFNRPDRQRLFEKIGDHLAIAIDNSRMFEATQHAADYDNRLGVYNRNYFDRQLPQLAERTVYSHNQMGLLLVDMDRLKYLNDTFGHQGGDAALRLIAKAIRSSVRTSDIVCRYGGDEFVVILPACTLDGMAAVAVKIMRIVRTIDSFVTASVLDEKAQRYIGDFLAIDASDLRQLQRPSDSSPEDKPLLSVSIGGALLPDSAPNSTELIKQADAALYAAKEEGRSRANIMTGMPGTIMALDLNATVNLERPRLAPGSERPTVSLPVAAAEPSEAELQSQLLSYIGHELRTPLAVIYSYAQIIRDRLPETPQFDRLRQMADKTVLQGDIMVAMIEELLEASRIQQHRLQLDLSDIDLHALLNHAVMHLDLEDSPRIAMHGVNHHGGDPLVVMADEQRLERAINVLIAMGINAVDLARRYRQSLGDAADVPEPPADRPDVLLWLWQLDGWATLDIYLPVVELQDDELTGLFDMTRAIRPTNPTTNAPTVRAGTIGLGLYVTRGIVELHGGRLHALRPSPYFGAFMQDKTPRPTGAVTYDALKSFVGPDGTLPGLLFSLSLPLHKRNGD